MNPILATEQTSETPQPLLPRPLLESWNSNERMRHIPPVSWMIEKVDTDVRHRIETLCEPIEMLFADDPQRVGADRELRRVCKALEWLAEVARHSRGATPPQMELARQVLWSIDHAAGSLRSLDADLIGRRFPFQTFERSKAEPLYAALLTVLASLDSLVDAVRAIDPDIDSRLLTHLVTLEEPMREEPMVIP